MESVFEEGRLTITQRLRERFVLFSEGLIVCVEILKSEVTVSMKLD